MLTDFDLAASDPLRGRFIHSDGRPFAEAEAALITGLKAADVRELSHRTAGRPDHDTRIQTAMELQRQWIYRQGSSVTRS